jgi:lipopolysaccharide transport protein LptA
MKLLPLLTLVLLLTWNVSAHAQDATDANPPPPGSTVITSDELHSDQVARISVFNGNVMVAGSSFNMTCDEMKVLFDKEGKVNHIIATGNVIITQPGRVTHSGQAEYFAEDDKFVLTDQPTIVDNKNRLSAPKIIIYRTDQKLVTEGKSTITLPSGSLGSSSSSPSSAPLPQQ